MSPLRTPTVGGLAGGVGATTVARALHAREVGPAGGLRLPDIVVCRATVSGLALAERPGGLPAPAPVLAVTADTGEPRGPVERRLASVADAWAAAVVLPRVPHWAQIEDPLAEAAGLLGLAEPAAPLRPYAEALARIVARLTAGGRLERDGGGPDGRGALRPVRGIRVGIAAAEHTGAAW